MNKVFAVTDETDDRQKAEYLIKQGWQLIDEFKSRENRIVYVLGLTGEKEAAIVKKKQEQSYFHLSPIFTIISVVFGIILIVDRKSVV